MVYANAAGHRHVVMNVDVSTQHDSVCHDHVIAYTAIVRHVATTHDKAIVADASDAFFFFRRSVDRSAFADQIAVADNDLSIAAAKAQVLWFIPDDNAGANSVVVADRGMAGDRHVVLQHGAPANFHIGTNHAKRTDIDIVINFRFGIDDRVLRNSSGIGASRFGPLTFSIERNNFVHAAPWGKGLS